MFSTDEWLDKLWYIFTQWNTTHQLKRKIQAMWINCKSILLSERSQRKKATCCMFHLYDILKQAKLQGKKSDQWLPLANGGVKEYKGTFKVVEMFYTPIYMNVDI